MKKIFLLISIMTAFAQAKVPMTFGVGGYFQGGNAYEDGGVILQYKLDPNLAVDWVLSTDIDTYSTSVRFLGIFNDIFKFPRGNLNLYAGGGAGFAGWDGGSAIQIMGSFGVGYEFENAPVEIFLYLDPTYENHFNSNYDQTITTLKLGGRYFFF